MESITNGMGLFACGVAATMGVAVWRERMNVRRACAAVAALCLAGCLFTLTREVWLGTAIPALVTLAAFAEVRRFLLPAVVAGALMTLLEIRTYCPEVIGKIEIFLDGGLRDGNDVLKALCLGATAVGVGRPFLYALAAYGTKGIERCVDSEYAPFLQ